MAVCEIRIPTYKRPALLARALDCLRRQTVSDLQIVIFDDSPGAEGRAVAEAATDLDIDYRQNPQNLGISRNLGQCFRTEPYGDARYVFCLEDDNTASPTLIEQNIVALEEAGVKAMLRDQAVEKADGSIDPARTTMPDMFRPGRVSPLSLLTSIFSNYGLSNGGLFWRFDLETELMIGEDCPDPVLIEYFRPFTFREDILFAAEPLGSWREDAENSFRPAADRHRERLNNYRLLRYLAGLRRQVLPLLTGEAGPGALYDRCEPSRWTRVDEALAHSLIPARPRDLSMQAMARHYAKGLAAATQAPSEIGARSASVVAAQIEWLVTHCVT